MGLVSIVGSGVAVSVTLRTGSGFSVMEVVGTLRSGAGGGVGAGVGTGIGVGTAWIGSVGLTGTLRAGLGGESEVDFLVACLLRMSCTCCSCWDSEGVRAGKCELVLGFCSIFNFHLWWTQAIVNLFVLGW